MSSYVKLIEVVEAIKGDVEKAEAGNKAATGRVRKAMQEVIYVPDQKLCLFIRFCLQNNGKLSSGKRNTHFAFLKNDELEAFEKIAVNCYEFNQFLICILHDSKATT